jgi:hypothetical protein
LQKSHELPTRKSIIGIERWKILCQKKSAGKKLVPPKISKAGKFSRRPSCSGFWQVVSFSNRLSNKSEFISMKNPHSLTPKSSYLTLNVPNYLPPQCVKKKRSKTML